MTKFSLAVFLLLCIFSLLECSSGQHFEVHGSISQKSRLLLEKLEKKQSTTIRSELHIESKIHHTSIEDLHIEKHLPRRFRPTKNFNKSEYPASSGEENDLRLPPNLKPSHQLIRIKPTIGGNWINYGYIEIDFDCLEATDIVEFHMKGIVTKNDTITLINVENPSVAYIFLRHEYNATKEVYRGFLAASLTEGQSYRISMEYEGLVNDGLVGFYRSYYDDYEAGTRTYLATTQFEAPFARLAFPCFDEPAMKATFDIEILRQPPRKAISNMPVISTVEDPDNHGSYWDIFNTTVPMSTYLIAFIVSDFEYIERHTNDNRIRFRIYCRHNSIHEAEYALEDGPDILSFYEDYYEINFPLQKQDMAAIPDYYFGAMENWGLITYREEALLYNPMESTAYDKQYVDMVMAHELAHQWFGDLVTMEWWSEIWLNEGFATYMSYLGVDSVRKEYDYLNFFGYTALQLALRFDSLEGTHPIYVQVDDPMNTNIGTVTYEKGASVIRMMRNFLTEATFRQALHNYLTKHSYGNAVTDDLWAAMTEQARLDGTLDPSLTVKQIMDTWTLQEGYPLLDVTVNKDGTASLSQARFLTFENPNMTNYDWWIPLTWTTSEDPTFGGQGVDMWMTNEEDTITITDLPPDASWVLFNVDQTGFFRVNYDTENWQALTEQLHQDHSVFSILSRGQLIDDVMNLAGAVPARVGYPVALDLLSYGAKETDYIPMRTALFELEYIEQMFTDTSGYADLRNFVLDLTRNLYNLVGFEDSIEDPFLFQLNRAAMVAVNCHFDEPSCKEKAIEAYALWMESPTENPISPNIKETVMCTAIANGGPEQWEFAWSMFLKANSKVERNALISAMGCSRQTYVLSRYFDRCFKENPSPLRSIEESNDVFYSVASNDYGNDFAYDYLNLNWDAMYQHFGGYSRLVYLESMITAEYNTWLDLLKIDEFKALHYRDLGSSVSSLDSSVDQTRKNIQWTKDNYNTILEWLQTYKKTH